MEKKNENPKSKQKSNYIFKSEYTKSNKTKWVFSSGKDRGNER